MRGRPDQAHGQEKMKKHAEILVELFGATSFPDHSANSVKALLGNKKIILYGAGDGFITFSVFVLKKYGLTASAVLDRKFTAAETHMGVPAFSPMAYTPSSEDRETATVVITVGKTKYHDDIFNCLRGLGFKKMILASDIYEYHLLQTPEELEQKGFRYYLDHQDAIRACLDLFSDDLSLDIFAGILQTHMRRKPIRIPCRALEEQYFPQDIRLSKGYSRVINCGSYHGDTVMQINRHFGKVESIACFEPDPDNYAALTRLFSAKRNDIAKDVIAFPCGVYSSDAQLRFAGGNRINSGISDTGESFIQCVALDHAVPGFKPTFMNMDVEGAELEALRGAEGLIRENVPDLAICVYHAPNHLWEIPRHIENLNLGYKLYLRNYTSFVSETVLYATTA